MVALIVAVAPNLPGFINAATQKKLFPPVFDAVYGYAWFVGLALAMLIYYVLTQLLSKPQSANISRQSS